ncbi:phosphotransferase enzyme family-domain-containing protein [Zopfochytrium polystomum]|nr:phosphotransferase enzyme family-domain-containing protein [Zopfochytrium polystomum]
MAETNSPHFLAFPTADSIDSSESEESRRFRFIKDFVRTAARNCEPLMACGEVTGFTAIAIGWNNRAVRIQTASGLKLILRLSKASWPRAKIENEVAVLRLLGDDYPQIPTPRLLAYGFASGGNPDSDGAGVGASKELVVPFHWMIMDCVDGDNLETVWRSFGLEDKHVILQQTADIVKCLQSKTYNTIGGWQLDPSSGAPRVGPYWEGGFAVANEAEFLMNRFDANVESLRAKKNPPDELVELLRDLDALRPQLAASAARFVASSPVPTVLFHGDFAFRNIIVTGGGGGGGEETRRPRIAAVLDWEWAGTRPIHVDWVVGDLLDVKDEEDARENEWIRGEIARLGASGWIGRWEGGGGGGGDVGAARRAAYMLAVDGTAEWNFSVGGTREAMREFQLYFQQ